MLVCQDCGSHRIAETGGTDLVAECPKCGLPVREGDVGVTTTEAEGLAHTTCPEPGTPLRPQTVPVSTDVPTKEAYDLSANQEHLSALGQLGQSDAGKDVLADVPKPDVAPIPADAPALQDPASAALLASGAPIGAPAGPGGDVAPAVTSTAPDVEVEDRAALDSDDEKIAADEAKLKADEAGKPKLP